MFIHGIILGLFLLPCFLIGSEKQSDKTEQEKRNENAEIYREIAAALGAHPSKTNNTSTISSSLTQALQQKDKKAKL